MEYMLLDKPVVTFRNTNPGKHLIDVTDTSQIAPAIERALSRPDELLKNIREYTARHEAHRDGKNSARVIDAVDDFIDKYKGKIRKKPLNLLRRMKLRWRLKKFVI